MSGRKSAVLENSRYPCSAQNDLQTQSGWKLFSGKVCWKDICGTGKQQISVQRTKRFTDAERLEIVFG